MAERKSFDLAAVLGAVSKLDTGAVDSREQIEYIDLKQIKPDERNFYELSGINELAANIELIGLQQPIRVRPNTEADGTYIIVSGHRRYAAVSQLVGEGQNRFWQVPCIVERSSAQSSEIEQQMQELRLIYANSDTRRMTGAEISKQAERVEMLLYQLKAAGVKFPGKMRDHVAEACQVSASKLARLKMIREKLIPELKTAWENGKLTEIVAYDCARLSAEVQQKLVILGKENGNQPNYSLWYDASVRERVRWIENSSKPTCEHGACVNASARLSCIGSANGSIARGWNCIFGRCCSGCSHISECPQACPHLIGEVKRAKEEEKALEAERLAIEEQKERPAIDQLTALWTRFAEARVAAGLSKEKYAELMKLKPTDEELELWTSRERGERIDAKSELLYLGRHYKLLATLNDLCRAADILGVSLDYLLGRTDNDCIEKGEKNNDKELY